MANGNSSSGDLQARREHFARLLEDAQQRVDAATHDRDKYQKALEAVETLLEIEEPIMAKSEPVAAETAKVPAFTKVKSMGLRGAIEFIVAQHDDGITPRRIMEILEEHGVKIASNNRVHAELHVLNRTARVVRAGEGVYVRGPKSKARKLPDKTLF